METENKFTAIYSFKVADKDREVFIVAWTQLTEMIYKYEGSYGSRLHDAGDGIFIGYAQWPDRKIWENSGTKLPEEAVQIRETLSNSCSEIKTEFEMSVVKDLLSDKTFLP